MKFLCGGSDLRDATTKIKSVLNNKSPDAVLSGVKVVAKSNFVTFTASNSEIAINRTINADVKIEGETVVEGSFFCGLCNLLRDNQIEIVVSENRMTIKYGENVVDANCYDPLDYPRQVEAEKSNSFEMVSNDFCELVKKVEFCASIEDSRPILKGIYLEIESNLITGVALDGYRLAKASKQIIENNIQQKLAVVVPAKSLDETAKTIGGTLDHINISVGKSHIFVNAGHTKITIRLLDGEYINYKQVIPTTFAGTIILPKNPLKSSIERVKLITVGEKSNALRMEFLQNQTILSSQSERGKITEKVSTKLDGVETKIGFNAKFVTEALDAIDTESITIKINNSTSPVLFLPTGDEGYLYLVLPLRL